MPGFGCVRKFDVKIRINCQWFSNMIGCPTSQSEGMLKYPYQLTWIVAWVFLSNPVPRRLALICDGKLCLLKRWCRCDAASASVTELRCGGDMAGMLNTSMPEQNGRHFTDDFLRYHRASTISRTLVARVEYPVPKHYTCQAVRSGFRESFSLLSIVVRMRRKIEVLPT